MFAKLQKGLRGWLQRLRSHLYLGIREYALPSHRIINKIIDRPVSDLRDRGARQDDSMLVTVR